LRAARIFSYFELPLAIIQAWKRLRQAVRSVEPTVDWIVESLIRSSDDTFVQTSLLFAMIMEMHGSVKQG
jgi:hypothetical protein